MTTEPSHGYNSSKHLNVVWFLGTGKRVHLNKQWWLLVQQVSSFCWWWWFQTEVPEHLSEKEHRITYCRGAPLGGGWTRWAPEAPSNLCDSVLISVAYLRLIPLNFAECFDDACYLLIPEISFTFDFLGKLGYLLILPFKEAFEGAPRNGWSLPLIQWDFCCSLQIKHVSRVAL